MVAGLRGLARRIRSAVYGASSVEGSGVVTLQKGVEAFEQAGLSADEHRKAQFGMPVGTTTTYALEGMEDMSPDEYMQAMLDKQMEERRQRRESAGGEVRAPLDSYFAQFNK